MFRKKSRKLSFDRTLFRPVIRKSICTGEESFGFLRLSDSAFLEVSLIRSPSELESMLSSYSLSRDEVEIIN